MDEIKPVAWRARFKNAPELGDWFSAEPIDGDLNETEPLYDQQAIDTLRAEVEDSEGAARVWRRRCQEAEARAERAEAEAEALRKLIWRVVAEANWRTSSHDLWFELVKATRETAIDAAKQAAE